MCRLLIFLGLVTCCFAANATADDTPVRKHIDARSFIVSIERGRVEWRFEALDLLQFPVIETFDGAALDEPELLPQVLIEPSGDFDSEPRLFLTVKIGW